MPVEDGTRIVPITPPTMSEMKPCWESCVDDALHLRPELILAHDNIKYHQYLLQIQKNYIKPDLRAFAKYEPFGEGDTLQGGGMFTDGGGTPEPSNVFRSLGGLHLADWTAGLYLNVPIGFRYEHAAIRAARLQLSQAYWVLRDNEMKAVRFLASQYQDVDRWFKQIQANRAEREAYQKSLQTLNAKIQSGQITISGTTAGATTVQVLQIQRSFAAALIKEYQSIASYNNALASLEWAKGTILRYNNVHIAEGALPQCAQTRAVEYEKDRQRLSLARKPRCAGSARCEADGARPARRQERKRCGVDPDVHDPRRYRACEPRAAPGRKLSAAAERSGPQAAGGRRLLAPAEDYRPQAAGAGAAARSAAAGTAQERQPPLFPLSGTPQVGTTGVVELEEQVVTPSFRPTPATPALPPLDLSGQRNAVLPAAYAPPGGVSAPPSRLTDWLPTSPPRPGGP